MFSHVLTNDKVFADDHRYRQIDPGRAARGVETRGARFQPIASLSTSRWTSSWSILFSEIRSHAATQSPRLKGLFLLQVHFPIRVMVLASRRVGHASGNLRYAP